jgi:hypothetical protein
MRPSTLEISINIPWRNFNPFLAGNNGKMYLGLMTLILCSIIFLTPILDATTPVWPINRYPNLIDPIMDG